MIKTLVRNDEVEMEIKKFFESIENIQASVDMFGILVEEQVTA